MGPDYGGGLPSDRVHGHPPPAGEGAFQLDHDRLNMTPSPSYSNGGYPLPSRPTGSPTLSAHSDLRRRSGERSRSKGRTGRSASGTLRTCEKCGEPLTGQFVRALDGTFHLECFKCHVSASTTACMVGPCTDKLNTGLWSDCRLQILPCRRRRHRWPVSPLRN